MSTSAPAHANSVNGRRMHPTRSPVAPSALRRHHDNKASLMLAIRRPAIRRLARRAGVILIGSAVYYETLALANKFAEETMFNAVTLVTSRRQKLIRARDAVYACRLAGAPVFGLDDDRDPL